ncbi:MAG: lytic transglycosylase domain-containing protein [Bdellovibrionaceae bacterium]|nr:lytic transglycosylase domain-containing protein [Pseudobdellovibrionaceae bacterium]
MTQTPVKSDGITGAARVLTTEEARLAELEDLKELHNQLMNKAKQAPAHRATVIFDLPVTYNRRVAFWLDHFQNRGRGWFREWLEKSTRYMPFIQKELRQAGLPADLAFMVMIESGFNPYARSPANAVGPWQFIGPTGKRYGLQQNWWLDERKDYKKATQAAISYMKDLYEEFGSWYLVSASYNMGENGLRRRIKRAGTRDFWALSKKGLLPQETVDYVPKILAVMLIAKAPSLYGFRDLAKMDVLDYEVVSMQGGTDLRHLADHLGITHKSLKDLNAELLLGYIPLQVEKHAIRIPKGARSLVIDYVQAGKSASVTQPPTPN